MTLLNALSHSKAGMIAESQRINAVASNIASAGAESSNAGGAYRAKKVVFSEVLNRDTGLRTLAVTQVIESQAAPSMRYAPNHPLADENGYVYGSNVNKVEEMADLTSASQSYETNAMVAGTVKQLLNKTLQLGK